MFKSLKIFDKFGENFSFNYNRYDKYSTRVGGLIFLIFIAIALTFFISSCFPFFRRENYSLQFYTVNFPTEKIKLINNFAYGIDCKNENNTKNAYKYFNIKIEYNKTNDTIETKNCDINDFGEGLKKDIEDLNIHDLKINNFSCIEKNENEITGLYTDTKKFAYYEIIVELVEGVDINSANNFLKEKDCKLQFYYKDYILDMQNYLHPIKPILNSLFIQINPGFTVKKNVYFMKYHFENNNKLIEPYMDNYKIKIDKKKEGVVYSRIEDYFLYNNNTNNTNNTNITYASLYLRADDRKIEINREYQNFLDFYAENTSFWFGIFEILNIFFTIYNGFHANLSMSKKLFFFDEKNDDIKRKNSINSNKSLKISRNSINTISIINLNDNNNANNDNNNSNNDNNNINNDNNDNTDNNDNNDKNITNKSYIFKQTYYNNYIIPSEMHINSEEEPKISKKSTIQIEKEENKNENENYIGLFEIIKISFYTFCKCCEKNIKLKAKEKIVKEAMDIFDKKLDIYIYIKNMILIDIMYQILMSDINKDYINFLSRSLNYLNKNDKKEKEELYEIYAPTIKLNSDYSNKLYKKFLKLIGKENKTEIEKKIISLYKN